MRRPCNAEDGTLSSPATPAPLPRTPKASHSPASGRLTRMSTPSASIYSSGTHTLGIRPRLVQLLPYSRRPVLWTGLRDYEQMLCYERYLSPSSGWDQAALGARVCNTRAHWSTQLKAAFAAPSQAYARRRTFPWVRVASNQAHDSNILDSLWASRSGVLR